MDIHSGAIQIMKQPNIILCACDQPRIFELRCDGNPVIQTLNVNRRPEEGLRVATAVRHISVRMLARSVLLAGQYIRTGTGGVDNVSYALPSGRWLMPEYPSRTPFIGEQTHGALIRECA